MILFISLHTCFHLHEVENIHQYVFIKKYLMISTISRLETVNKSVSKNFCDVFVFTKGKVCKYFIYWLFLFDGNYSNNNIFVFLQFFPQFVKSLSKTLYLWEIKNVVWK